MRKSKFPPVGEGMGIRNADAGAPDVSQLLRNPRAYSQEIAVTDIMPDPEQPRREFDQASLMELAESIRQNGVMQPIVVKPIVDGKHALVCGERRYRAAVLAEVLTIPAVVRDLTPVEKMTWQLSENMLREDLSEPEKGAFFVRFCQILKEQGHSDPWTEITRVTGFSMDRLTRLRQAHELEEPVKVMMAKKELSATHTLPLHTLKDSPDAEIVLAKAASNYQLTVQQTRKAANQLVSMRASGTLPSDTGALEQTVIHVAEQIKHDARRKPSPVPNSGSPVCTDTELPPINVQPANDTAPVCTDTDLQAVNSETAEDALVVILDKTRREIVSLLARDGARLELSDRLRSSLEALRTSLNQLQDRYR